MFEIFFEADCVTDVRPEGPFGLRISRNRHGETSCIVVGRFDPIMRDRLVGLFGRHLTGPRARRLCGPDLTLDFQGSVDAWADLPNGPTSSIYVGWRRAPSDLERAWVRFDHLDEAQAAELLVIVNGSVPAGMVPPAAPVVMASDSPPVVPTSRIDEMIAAREDARAPKFVPTGSWAPRPHEAVPAGEFGDATRTRHGDRAGG